MSRTDKRSAIPLLVAMFSVVLVLLILNGGMCERYERKMERQRLMREYIDSQRSEEQLKKLHRDSGSH